MSYYERPLSKSNLYRYLRIAFKNNSIFTEIYGFFWPKNLYKNNFTSKTQLIVDGPPRCANHFILEHLNQQFTQIEVAHHYHAVGLAKLGSKYSLPTIILIRNPKDQLLSGSLYSKEITMKILLLELHNYYKELLKIKNIVISDFERSTKDPFSIVKEVFHQYREKLPETKIKQFSDEFIFNKIKMRKVELSQIAMKAPIPSKIKNDKKINKLAEIEEILDTKLGRLTLKNYQILKKISDAKWIQFKSE